MILAIAIVVVGRTPHLALDDHDEFVSNLKSFRFAQQVIDTG